jgi:starch synthase
MRQDIFRAYPQLDREKVSVVHNGIDCTRWKPMEVPGVIERHGLDKSRPSVVFVGRITRQKGLTYFLRAARQLPEDVQLILCAGAADTPEILSEVQMLVEQLQKERSGVIWIPEHLPQEQLATLLGAADLFVCPSIYEPLGIVNLEAMACATAIVATKTGGIPEVVSANETGWLVPIDQATDGSGTPLDPEKFIGDFAKAMNHAISSPKLKQFGEAGRARAELLFSWDSIATRTLEVYRQALER